MSLHTCTRCFIERNKLINWRRKADVFELYLILCAIDLCANHSGIKQWLHDLHLCPFHHWRWKKASISQSVVLCLSGTIKCRSMHELVWWRVRTHNLEFYIQSNHIECQCKKFMLYYHIRNCCDYCVSVNHSHFSIAFSVLFHWKDLINYIDLECYH